MLAGFIDDEDDDNGDAYLSMENAKCGPTDRTTRRLPHGAADSTVCVRIPGHEGAPARALEVDDGHVAVSEVGVGSIDRRHVELESNETEGLARGQRFAVLRGVKSAGFEVEGVEVVEVQEADDAHPSPRHAVRVNGIKVGVKAGPEFAAQGGGYVAVGGDAEEGLVPGPENAGVRGRRRPAALGIHSVVEPYDDHDGLNFFPVDSSGAVVHLCRQAIDVSKRGEEIPAFLWQE